MSYPYLFYTGLTPDCREIIVANLADTQQPQKIIRLPDDLQLQVLVPSHLDDRIYFLANEPGSGTRGDYELLLRFPSLKNEDYDYHDVRIRRLH